MSERPVYYDLPAMLEAESDVRDAMQDLSYDERLAVFLGLMASEICTRPASDRSAELDRVMREAPQVLRLMEASMRDVLARKARRGE
jgi:hypothetical protein